MRHTGGQFHCAFLHTTLCCALCSEVCILGDAALIHVNLTCPPTWWAWHQSPRVTRVQGVNTWVLRSSKMTADWTKPFSSPWHHTRPSMQRWVPLQDPTWKYTNVKLTSTNTIVYRQGCLTKWVATSLLTVSWQWLEQASRNIETNLRTHSASLLTMTRAS